MIRSCDLTPLELPMIRSLTLLLVLTSLCAPALAQERGTDAPPAKTATVTPQWTFTVGSVDRYEQIATISMNVTSPMGVNTNTMVVTSEWTQSVTAVDAKGLATVSLHFTVVKMKVSNAMGTVVDFDSSRPEDMERAKTSAQLQPLSDMVGKTQELTIDKTGKVHTASAGVGITTTRDDWQAMFLKGTSQAVKVGGTWTSKRVVDKPGSKMDFANTHTLKSVSGGKATVATASTAKADFSSNPQLAGAATKVTKAAGEQTDVVDFARGRVHSIKGTFTLHMTIQQGGGEIVQKVASKNAINWLGAGKPKPKAAPTSKPTSKPGEDF